MTWSLAQRELLVTLAVPGPADAEVVFLHLLETHSPETSCHPCSFPPVVSAKQPQAPMIDQSSKLLTDNLILILHIILPLFSHLEIILFVVEVQETQTIRVKK